LVLNYQNTGSMHSLIHTPDVTLNLPISLLYNDNASYRDACQYA